MNVGKDPPRKKMISMRTLLCGSTVLIAWLLLCSGSFGAAQEAPFLSHGSVYEESVTITLRGSPGDHCVLFWSVSEGQTAFDLPASLGGRVTLGLAPAWLFTSTLDGGIAFSSEGIWTFKLPSLPLIRTLVDRLHFQAVSFHNNGSRMESSVSNRLDVDISEPVSPKSNFEKALDVLRQQRLRTESGLPAYQGRPSVFDERRVTTSQGAYRYDPFGNRIEFLQAVTSFEATYKDLP